MDAVTAAVSTYHIILVADMDGDGSVVAVSAKPDLDLKVLFSGIRQVQVAKWLHSLI